MYLKFSKTQMTTSSMSVHGLVQRKLAQNEIELKKLF